MGRRPSRDRSTIGDVADAAGVSRATVSRVMNGLATVDPRIAARVRATAVELRLPAQPGGPQPGSRTDPDHRVRRARPDQPVLPRRAARADPGQPPSRATGCWWPTAPNTPRRSPCSRWRPGVGATPWCWCAPRMPDEELARLLPDLQPACCSTAGSRAPACRSSTSTGRPGSATWSATSTGLGHRRIAYLQGPAGQSRPTPPGSGPRRRGRRRGGQDRLRRDVRTTGTPRPGRCSTPGVTAVVAFNDVVALGLLGALHELGTDVPGELSVVGFDDIPFAAYTLAAADHGVGAPGADGSTGVGAAVGAAGLDRRATRHEQVADATAAGRPGQHRVVHRRSS